MRWLHGGWQLAALLVGLAAGYGGLLRYFGRTRDTSPLPGTLSRRGHQTLGWVFAVMLAVGYGLGLLTVHRAGREVLTAPDALPHALVGTMVVMFAAIVALLGTALASREERKLRRLHRLFAAVTLVLVALQVVLGVGLMFRRAAL